VNAFVKTRVPACCGSFSTVYRLSFSLKKESITQFEGAGFSVSRPYYKVGMFYAENNNIIVSGKFGSATFDLKCKTPKCEDMTTGFEAVLTQLYEATKV
jgi:hypothetical protein